MGTVLVVDDNPDLCKAIMKMIRMIGAHADCVLSGHEALDYVKAKSVSMLVLDYMMPDINGLDVLRKLRSDEKTRDIPVVMCTAFSDDSLKEEAKRIGAQGFLVKSALDFDKLKPYVVTFAKPTTPAEGA